MLAMGRGLMVDPAVLILDEPSAGLSPRFQGLIWERIEQVRATDVAVLVVEQNTRETLRHAHWAYVLSLGQNRLEGPGRDLAALRGLTLTGLASLGYVTFVATLFGFGVWGVLLRRYGASAVAPFAMLAPVFAVVSGAVILAQPVHLTDVVGGLFVLGGIAFGLTRAPARAPSAAAEIPVPAGRS